jgi:hypothetical protein
MPAKTNISIKNRPQNGLEREEDIAQICSTYYGINWATVL